MSAPDTNADARLSAKELEALYRVVDETVQVVLVGRKSGNFLIIDRKRFIL